MLPAKFEAARHKADLYKASKKAQRCEAARIARSSSGAFRSILPTALGDTVHYRVEWCNTIMQLRRVLNPGRQGRPMMRPAKLTFATILAFFVAVLASAAQKKSGMSAQQALKKLETGNQRYVAGRMSNPNQTPECRARVAKGQHPFAIVLSCSDSRVPPEVIFDRGLGDLFTVRVAGNIAEPATTGSIEYAAEHLGSPLLVVLGHSRCGAVEAAVKSGEAPGRIADIIAAIRPAVQRVKGMPGDPVDNAVRANVRMVVEQLKSAQPVLSHLVEEGRLKIVGAYYDLDTGKVEILR
ncbi:MAG: carbonic anhydrase [Terriglobia bacterium]